MTDRCMRLLEYLGSQFFILVLAVMIVGSMGVNSTAMAADSEAISCECEESSCGACEIEEGVNFYSAKCGPQNSRVKSCKKPQCIPVENQKQCLALLGSKAGEIIAESNEEQKKSLAPIQVSSRAPAASVIFAGEVIDTMGTAKLWRTSGNADSPKRGLPVHEGDTVETKGDGRVKIKLLDETEMIVPPNSTVKVEKFVHDAARGARQVTLQLLMGKVRNKVAKKIDSESEFKVKTRAAVAGVRGTDFITVFEPGEKEWVSEVRTLSGLVMLEGAAPAEGSATSKSVEVGAGNYASFVIPALSPSASAADVSAAVSKGFVTPLFKMKDDEIRALDESLDFSSEAEAKVQAASRRSASTHSDVVCAAPAGKFNQCAWSCEGNPKGEKKCRTDKEGVSCVRRLCRANGQWVEPRRMPSSQSDLCNPEQTVVKECGSYW